jgi:hypothetical protein
MTVNLESLPCVGSARQEACHFAAKTAANKSPNQANILRAADVVALLHAIAPRFSARRMNKKRIMQRMRPQR